MILNKDVEEAILKAHSKPLIPIDFTTGTGQSSYAKKKIKWIPVVNSVKEIQLILGQTGESLLTPSQDGEALF